MGNILLALGALLSTTISVLSVLTLMMRLGWSLGLTEAVCLLFMMGMITGYSVHMAMDHDLQPYRLRAKKMNNTFGNTGALVLLGSVGSIGSAGLLFGTKLLPLWKLAVVLIG